MTVMLMAILPCRLDETSPSLLVEDQFIRIVYARGGGVYNLGMFTFDMTTVIAHNHASTSHDNIFP